MSQGRSLYREIFQNFLKSILPRTAYGKMIGRDHFGTEYYEAPGNTTGHRSRPTRWFIPVQKNNFQQEMPPEWTAWLRHSRKDPPTEEEIQTNILKMKQTIENARKLEAPKTVKTDEIKTFDKQPFPVYEEYDLHPGSNRKKE